MSKENREPAMALIEKLVNSGLTQTKISTDVGFGPWWVSGVKTKGDGVSDEALEKLHTLVEKRFKHSAKTNGRHRRLGKSKSRELVLSLFKNDSIKLPKELIMKKGLGMGMSCGAIENTLYALKANGKLESPTRGHYKLPKKKERTSPIPSGNGNGHMTVNARSFKRLMKDVRIIKKLMRKQEAS